MLRSSPRFQSLLGIGLTAALGLLGFAFLARGLSEAELGRWAFFLMVYTLIDVFRSGFISNGLIKFLNETRETAESERLSAAGFELSLALSAVVALPALLLAAVLFFCCPSLDSWFLAAGGLSLILSVPSSIALWTLNAEGRYKEILHLRLWLQWPLFAASILVFLGYLGLVELVGVYLLCQLLGSLWALRKTVRWPHSWYAKERSGQRIQIIRFGRYSVGSVLGSSLLKSSDALLLMPFLGPASVAAYNVPERLLGLFEIPVRSFVQTAYPRLVRIKEDGDAAFASNLQKETGLLFVLMAPMVILVWMFAPQLVVLLGGEAYRHSASVLRFFAVYTALIPFDRLSGIALDVYGRPERNMLKVLLMLAVNVVGDLMALSLGGGITEVAAVSVLTFGSGIGLGYFFLRDKIRFSFLGIVSDGWNEVARIGNRLLPGGGR